MPGIRASLSTGSLLGALVVALVLAAAPVQQANAYLTDTASHPPPTTGGQAYYNTYGTWGPDRTGFPAKGQSYVDPVFGSTVTRLTNEMGQQSLSDIYAKNGYTNADNTLTAHATSGARQFLSTSSGAVVRASVPGNDNSSFDPVNPDVWWWYSFGGTTLNKYSVSSGASTTVKNFGVAIGNNGGSTDWIDGSGRYMLLRLGSSWRIYDVQSDVLYAGAIPDSYGGTTGWAGISPDGRWVITTDTGPAMHRSWPINHSTRTLSTTPNVFWTLCGDHGDLVSGSNGKTYFVTFECDSVAAVFAVDVSIPQSATNKAKQIADNRQLFKTAWADSGHFSGVSKGALRDWAFVSVESGDDTFGSTVTGWRAFMQEIVMANVVTGEVRRIAHHRSRSPQSNYYYTPRVSASWDGSVVTWASNMGYNGSGYADIYLARISGATSGGGTGGGTTTPTPLSATFTNPASGATVSGTVTVSVSATGGSGSGYSYTVNAGGNTIYSGTNTTFSWNTTTTANGSVALSVTARDSAGATASASRTVTVSNTTTAPAPLWVSFTSPAAGTTVAGSVSVTLAASGGSRSGYTYTVSAAGITLYSGTNPGFTLNTLALANGLVTLTGTVRDSAGATASTTRSLSVSNTTSGGTGGTGTGTAQNVVWTSPVRVSVSGNTITKTSGCNGCWDAGAASQQTIGSAGGYVQFAIPGGTAATVGLSNGNAGTSANEIKFGLRFYPGSPGIVEVRESGVYKWDMYHVAGAVYKVAIESGKVKYYQNGTLKYTSAAVPTYPLVLDSTIDVVGSAVQNAVIATGTTSTSTGGTSTGGTTTGGTTTGGTTTPTGTTTQNVVWINAVRVAVSGNTITKNTGCSGCWDAGATSQQTISSVGGSVEFTVSAGAVATVGLGNGNTGTSANEVKFGLRFYASGNVEVREGGLYKADFAPVAGAVYKVSVEAGRVKYYQNGTLKYTSAAVPAYPLLVDTSLELLNTAVQNAIIRN